MSKATVENTEKLIGSLLAKLELDTGDLVKSVYISEVEVTTFADKRPKFRRQIIIKLERVPGSEWT